MSIRAIALVVLAACASGCGDDATPTCPDGFVLTGRVCLPAVEDVGSDVVDSGADGSDVTVDAATECSPSSEACNGDDDDCDGRVDEDSSETCGTNVGICTEGIRSCSGGTLDACDGVGSSTEICDRILDEDCDGSVDEGCACTDGETRPCGLDVGECESGLQTCGGGTWQACAGGVGPSAEACSGMDEDCDGEVDEGDPGGGASCGTDVGECTAGVSRCVAGALSCVGESVAEPERCNSRDDDCDGSTDEGSTTRYYRDADGDTRGDPAASVDACAQPPGYVSNSNDCDDTCNVCWTGHVEVCDLENNDCDSNTDEGLGSTFFRDSDGDTFGDITTPITACSAPAGHVTNDGDCDDGDARVNPAATAYFSTPRARGGWDFDCDGTTSYEFPANALDDREYCFTTCSPLTTWDGPRPGCGSSGTTFVCTFSSSRCNATGHTTRTQRCR